MQGSPNADTFLGGPSNVTIDGGGGSDILSFAGAPAGVTFDLSAPSQKVTGSGIDETISGFEDFTGASVGGNTFDAPAGGGYGFTVGGSTPGQSGQVLNLSSGIGGSTTDTFADISSFIDAASSTSAVVNDAATGDVRGGAEVSGASAYAEAVVSGVGDVTPTGTVTYSFFANGTCSGSASWTQLVTLSAGGAPSSNPTSPLTPGAYSFNASYSGDGSYRPSTSSCASFAVPGPPSVTITSPSDGASYRKGQAVSANYSCAEGAGGPGIKSAGGCVGPAANGAAIDTATPGAHAFTMVATSSDGQTTSRTAHYTVLLQPARIGITTTATRVRSDGALTVSLRCGPGSGRCAGTLTLRVEVHVGRGRRARIETRKIASTRFAVNAGHETSVKLTLTKTGRQLLVAATDHKLSAAATAVTKTNTARRQISLR